MYYFSEIAGADDLFCAFYDYDYRGLPSEFYCNLYTVLKEMQEKWYGGDSNGELYFSPDCIMNEIIITRYGWLDDARKFCSHKKNGGVYILPSSGNILDGFNDLEQKTLAGGDPAVYLCTDYNKHIIYSSCFKWFRGVK